MICHRILMLDTLDQAQALALTEKASTQAGLRNAVKISLDTRDLIVLHCRTMTNYQAGPEGW